MSVQIKQPWVIGNWKMNPTWQQAVSLLAALSQQAQQSLPGVKVAIAPTTLALMSSQHYLQEQQSSLYLAAQDLSRFAQTGAFTGEVSASLLAEAGVQLVLVGHSERRELLAEGPSILNEKIRRALDAGLQVVYCVGESLAQREQGLAQQVVAQQLCDIAPSVAENEWPQFIIAYEPIWAIGTGKTASPEDAQAMHAHIRDVLKQLHAQAAQCSILYGGSVKPENAVELAACADIDGALVGGAALDAHAFFAIVTAFAQAKAQGV